MRYQRLRLGLLSLLRVRQKDGFTPLSRGLGATDMMLDRLKAHGPGGDYYQFGLFRGYSFWYAQHAANRVNLDDAFLRV
jgi:hypothetical protein